jgi:glycosyltransferase involved in cell wall biosynthesis
MDDRIGQAVVKPRHHRRRPQICVVTPVFNEAGNVERFVEEVERDLLSCDNAQIRILFVDDGSSDGSWSKIEQIVKRSSQFSAIKLSRNFGAHTALLAGFDHIADDVDAVATLACDLQDPPTTVLSFVREWRDGADIVWGVRRTRSDGTVRKTVSRLLEWLLRRYAMPRNSRFCTGSFLLIDRVVLDCVREFREHARVTFALVAWTGFCQAVVLYDRRPRRDGHSGWSFGQLVNTVYDVFIGFSPVPAKMLTVFGFLMLALSLVVVCCLIGDWYLYKVQPGWTGLMATITLCFGILFVMLGIAFEYLYRIFVETKNRPLYFVARRVGEMAVLEKTHG